MEHHFTEATEVFYIAILVEESFHVKWKPVGNELLLEENPRTGHRKEGGVRGKTNRNDYKPLPSEFISLNQDL